MKRNGFALVFSLFAAAALAQQPPQVPAPDPVPPVRAEFDVSDRCTLRSTMTFTPPANAGRPQTSATEMTWVVRRHVKAFDNGDLSVKYDEVAASGLPAALPADLVAALLATEYVVSPAGQASARDGRSLTTDASAFLLTDVARLPAGGNVGLGDGVRGQTISVPADKILPLAVIAGRDIQLDLLHIGTTAGNDEFTATVKSKEPATRALKGRLTASSDRKQLRVELEGSTSDKTPFGATAGDLRRDSRMNVRCERSVR